MPCDVQFYGQDSSQSCAPCHSSCKNCIGSFDTECISCDPALSYFQPSTGKCIACTSTTKYGNDTTQNCELCHADCLTCQGPTNKHCLSCNVRNSYLDVFWSTCVKCAAKQYGNSDQMSCAACDETCASCKGPTKNDCVTCNNIVSYLNYSMSACDPCSAGTYGDDLTQKCYTCDATCVSCSGAGPNKCVSCYNVERVLNQATSACTLCALQFYGNENTHSCESCHPSCLRCTGPAKEECTSCSFQAFRNNGTGICELCPDMNYGSDID